ncbi:MAG: transcription termination factor Rho [Phycisphaerae bacterium]|nr:transcription termination factor Rho [Phycisphaerae bacterium]MBT5382215.1 transcription termination factor Rho [Phycisphaerae bacterium]MBT5584182.1 transcription termination factor Rho [Phycisphaerae bacterium]MBT5657483.1 transcription termination factor Rho [Phycisphaerae bacterium]
MSTASTPSKAPDRSRPEKKSSDSSVSGSSEDSGGSGGGERSSHNPGGHQGGHQGNKQRSRNKQGGGNKKRRRRNSKGKPGGNAAIPVVTLEPGSVPTDEQIAEESQALESSLDKKTRAKYEKAKKDGLDFAVLQKLSGPKLVKVAEDDGIEHAATLSKQQLVFEILCSRADKQGLMIGEGTLEISPEGYGFLRSPEYSYSPSPDDIYVSPAQVKLFGLRRGQVVSGLIRPPKETEKYFAMLRVESVNGTDPAEAAHLPTFENLTPLHPEDRITLETEPDIIETRVIDLVAPLGFGQRALIVAPPRTGKTVLLQKITKAIAINHPDAHVIVLLVDERPEEVTDFKRNTIDTVEVVASTFDEHATRHIQVAEIVMEKARRIVEAGGKVVVLLDSITRLARGYNNATSGSGKIGTGGVDNAALIKPKKFFGSARNIEDGGSLSIIATALVDTGSKADEVIFEEFKGTGNSELHLTRKLVEKRIWPAIDIPASGTRREELLLDAQELDLVGSLRKVVSDMSVIEAMELLRNRLSKTKSNAEFLMTMNLG